MATWLRLTLLIAAVPVVGMGLLFISSLFTTEASAPTITVLSCGANQLRFVRAAHKNFFNSYNSQEFYWNDRLIDLDGRGFGPGRWRFIPFGLHRLFPAGPPLPGGSGLEFYPAALPADALPQRRLQARDTAAHENLIWVNPGQFTPAEFDQIGDCLRNHAAAINAALSRDDVALRFPRLTQLTRLVYADFRQYARPLSFGSAGRNQTGGYDSLEIAANGSVWLHRGNDIASVTGKQFGARVPGTTNLLFRAISPANGAPSPDEMLDVLAAGPLPTLAELGRYQDAQGHPLSASFQLRYLSAEDERLAASGKHPLF